MKHDQVGERRRAEKRSHIIKTAEQVLAQAYRAATRDEMIASQMRVRESIVREMKRRAK